MRSLASSSLWSSSRLLAAITDGKWVAGACAAADDDDADANDGADADDDDDAGTDAADADAADADDADADDADDPRGGLRLSGLLRALPP